MASKRVVFKNNFGKCKVAPVGFSVTTMFFGSFVPAVRRDFRGLFIMWLSYPFTLGIALLAWPFIYNKMYIKSLVQNGYVATDFIGTSKSEVEAIIGMEIQETKVP
jgi:hypothetical protein